MVASLFHHGSLEFAAPELERILEVCAAVPTVVDVCGPASSPPPLLQRARVIVANFGLTESALLDVLFGTPPPRQTPFDLPRSDDAVADSRSDVPSTPSIRYSDSVRAALLTPECSPVPTAPPSELRCNSRVHT